MKYGLKIANSEIPGTRVVHKFGNNPDVDDSATFEDIWNGGGDYTGFNATAAELVTVVSDSDADDVDGTGALTVKLYGLDANYRYQTEIVTMTGQTPLDSVKLYIRMPRAKVLTAGSGGANAGAITIAQKSTTANVFAVIQPGLNQTTIAADTVPAGKVGYISSWLGSLAGSNQADCAVKVQVRPFGGVFEHKTQLSLHGAGSSYVKHVHEIPEGPYSAKSDIKISANSDADNTSISGGFSLILVDA